MISEKLIRFVMPLFVLLAFATPVFAKGEKYDYVSGYVAGDVIGSEGMYGSKSYKWPGNGKTYEILTTVGFDKQSDPDLYLATGIIVYPVGSTNSNEVMDCVFEIRVDAADKNKGTFDLYGNTGVSANTKEFCSDLKGQFDTSVAVLNSGIAPPPTVGGGFCDEFNKGIFKGVYKRSPCVIDNVNQVFIVAGNILSLLVGLIAGLFAIFMVKGGLAYIISSGAPDRVRDAKATINNAIVGLVIALIAFGIVRLLVTALGGTIV